MYEESIIYVVVSGLLASGPDPGLSPGAESIVASLRSLLPHCPPVVCCATGRAERETAWALGLRVDRYSSALGTSERLVTTDDGPCILFADGTMIPAILSTSLEDRRRAFTGILSSLPPESVVITNRGSGIGILGVSHEDTPFVVRVNYGTERMPLDIVEVLIPPQKASTM
ncbi:MAG: hypothetical protein Q8Q20_05505 [bacterium]|nr:hypothetical protein [bacterium]